MILTLVVAASTNNAIGKDRQLLWHLPHDLAFFKNVTWAMPVLMGRKTFLSIGSKPLKGRMNMILTGNKNYKVDNSIIVHSVDEAIKHADDNDYKELMILGGGKVYADIINKADKIYLTRVHHVFEDADTFFPEINEQDWKCTFNADHDKDAKHAYDYSFQLWIKNK